MSEMLDLAGLRARPDLLRQIDWQADPQAVFQAYQIKSVDSWKQRDLEELLFFVVAYWPPAPPRVRLVRKTYTDSEDLAILAAPPELVEQSLREQGGQNPPGGLYALNASLLRWLEQAIYPGRPGDQES